MPRIIKLDNEYKIREDSALTISPLLLPFLQWELGDRCQYEIDMTDPAAPRLIVTAMKHIKENENEKNN